MILLVVHEKVYRNIDKFRKIIEIKSTKWTFKNRLKKGVLWKVFYKTEIVEGL
jgi:hypothetical protein